MGLDAKKLSSGVSRTTRADQPVHRRSLITDFVIRFVESIICKLATSEISIFWLVSVAEETGLKLALSETPKTVFVGKRSICRQQMICIPLSGINFTWCVRQNVETKLSSTSWGSRYASPNVCDSHFVVSQSCSE